MKLALWLVFGLIVAEGRKTRYVYKYNSYAAGSQIFWTGEGCRSFSHIFVSGGNGLVQDSSSSPVPDTQETVSINFVYFSDCTATGARAMQFDFSIFHPVPPGTPEFFRADRLGQAEISLTGEGRVQYMDCVTNDEIHLDDYDCTVVNAPGILQPFSLHFTMDAFGAKYKDRERTVIREPGYVAIRSGGTICKDGDVQTLNVTVGDFTLPVVGPLEVESGNICRIKIGSLDKYTIHNVA